MHARGRRHRRQRPPTYTVESWRGRVRHRTGHGGAGSSREPEPAPSILLVDDETAIRTICRVNLESDGMAVVEAADGREALERVREASPALVLLDVMMPGIDGWEVARQLAADPATRAIPIVFLSARAALDDRLRAQSFGAVGYIVKPFDPIELSGRIRTVLERIRRGEREQLNSELVDRE